MAKAFPGFSPKAITFLRQLKKNNSREWFTPRKQEFLDLLRNPMIELAGIVADEMRSFAVDYVREPAKAVHRIYRDVRFSKDKSPFKTNISAMFFRTGLPKNSSSGFYFSLSPDGFEIAGGLYMPGPPELAAVRKAIADDPSHFRRQVMPASLVKLMGDCKGEQLTRCPKGFEQHDDTVIELLRRKQFYYFQTLEAAAATRPGVEKPLLKMLRAMTPFNEFLNQILMAAMDKAEGPQRHPSRPQPMF